MLRFFRYVAQSELKTPICFKECGIPQSFPKDRVLILDPCNVDNNVGRKITDQDCKTIVEKCLTAWETLTYARNHGKDPDTGTVEGSFRPLIRDRGLNACTYSESLTQTYTIADIGKVVDCLAADLDMNAQSTGLLTREQVTTYAADVKAMAQSGYLLEANIVL